MRVSPIQKPLKLVAFAALSLLVVSCSTSRGPAQKSGGAVVRSQPGLDINRAHKDGAPWWDVDVSKIPAATLQPGGADGLCRGRVAGIFVAVDRAAGGDWRIGPVLPRIA